MIVFNVCQASGDSILLTNIVRGTCRYLLYGQVLGDYVEYVVSVWTSAMRGNDAECVIKRGITAEAVPIPVGLRQVVVL